MQNDIVLYEKEGPVGLITFNRPEVKNALNMAVFRRLNAVLDEVTKDDEVRVVLVTGSGNAFVAGADINELLSLNTTDGWSNSRYCQGVLTRLEKLGKPSIAAINGPALGGGLEVALSCTFRVASSAAKLGLPEVSLGIITGFGGAKRAVRAVGYAKAAELLLLSSLVSGEEAHRIGLVNVVVAPDQVMVRAREIAGYLCRLSPVAVRFGLDILSEAENGSLDSGFSLESALAALAVSSQEARQLLGRFLSKEKGK